MQKAKRCVRHSICLDIFFRAVKFYVVTTVVCNQQGGIELHFIRLNTCELPFVAVTIIAIIIINNITILPCLLACLLNTVLSILLSTIIHTTTHWLTLLVGLCYFCYFCVRYICFYLLLLHIIQLSASMVQISQRWFC